MESENSSIKSCMGKEIAETVEHINNKNSSRELGSRDLSNSENQRHTSDQNNNNSNESGVIQADVKWRPRTRKVSLPGKNSKVFTVVNHGDTSHVMPEISSEPQVLLPFEKNQNDVAGNQYKVEFQQSMNDCKKNQSYQQHQVPHIVVMSESSSHSFCEQNRNALSVPSLSNHFMHVSSEKEFSNAFPAEKIASSSDSEDPNTYTFRTLWKKNDSKVEFSKGNYQKIAREQNIVSDKRNLSFHNFASILSNPLVDIVKRGKALGKRKQDRLILKNGSINLATVAVENKKFRFFRDLFTTLVDVKWRCMILLLASAFVGTWVGFALIWWAIVAYQMHKGGPECISLVTDFKSALLFSVETQHTIGYGSRAVTTECDLAIFFVMLQSLVGVTMSCVTTGLVFAKFSSPQRKSDTIMFSKNAVLYQKDGSRYLGFRVGDIRQNHIIQVTIQAIMFKLETETLYLDQETPFQQHNLHVESKAENCFFLAWPIEVMHKIDRKSPFWDMSEDDLIDSDFEIVVVLEGVITSTGQSTQICTSYLPSEILWGEKLQPLITDRKQSGKYLMNYKNFDSTCPVNMSTHSAKYDAYIQKKPNKNSKR